VAISFRSVSERSTGSEQRLPAAVPVGSNSPESLANVTGLESVGISVDRPTETLKRLPAIPPKAQPGR
jgi:hypothetical protein